MKTVLLYQPKIEKKDVKPRSPPLALLSIASLLLEEKYRVQLFDAMTEKNAQDKVLENLNEALCLGVSVWVGYPIKDSLELCKKVKQLRPDIPIVWGGWHPSLFPGQTLENSNIDIVVRGQGEVTFLELVKCLEKKGSLDKIKGITYKKGGKIIKNPDRPRAHLDDIPPIPFHLIDVEKYLNDDIGSRTIGYISSQGCPYNCAFCADASLYKSKRIDLSAKRVIQDLKKLIEDYKVNGVLFEDTNFFVDKEKVKKICREIIKNRWDLRWGADARANHFITFDEKTIQLIKDSGCCLLIVGAESGSQRMLDFLNKRITVENTLKLTDIGKKFDIGIRFQFIVGLPDETSEDFQKTLKLMKHVYMNNPKNDITVYFYTPYPGTLLYKKVIKEYGFKPPQSLIEWANFDPINIEMRWVTKEYKEKLSIFLFYLQFAFLNKRFEKKINPSFKTPYLLIHKIARLRFNMDFFKFPVEIKIIHLIKRFIDKTRFF